MPEMFLTYPDIFFWDLTILLALAIFLSGTIACYVLARRNRDSKTKKPLFYFFFFLLLFFFLVTAYGSFVEPQLLITTSTKITHPLAPPVKIVVIADMHLGPYKGEEFVERVVKKVNAQLPDLVLIPGDFVYTTARDLSELAPLADIHAPMGVFAVLGNHDVGQYQTVFGERFAGKDRGDEIAGYLEQLDIAVLRSENQITTLADGMLAIAGIDDLWTGHVNLKRALSGIPEGTFTILLSHNPSVIDKPEAERADLIVSAHTHGGQIRLPGIGSLMRLPISIDQQFDQGVFALENDRYLAITRGVGESSPRSRLFAPPEVMVIEMYN